MRASLAPLVRLVLDRRTQAAAVALAAVLAALAGHGDAAAGAVTAYAA